MTETPDFWTMWAPYWSYMEDFLLDLDVITKLTTAIKSPVLIIGAGQGLLVEELQKKGFKVDGVDLDPYMVEYAEKRRGLVLIQANGKNVPFANKSYKTSIIATGVVDFMDDEEEIELIIREAHRVTDDLGKVLVAFYKYHPKVEELLRYTGTITDKGLLRFRHLHEMTKLSFDNPMGYIRAVKNDANVGFLRAFLVLVKVLMFLPKKEKREIKGMSKLWKQASKELDNPELLVDCVPEYIPYRNEERVRDLFKRLRIPIRSMLVYDSCSVVQLFG